MGILNMNELDILLKEKGKRASLSPDKNFLVLIEDDSPTVLAYKKNEDDFLELIKSEELPSGTGHGLAFSLDGGHVAVVNGSAPFATVYSVGEGSFRKVSDPSPLPDSLSYKMSFSIGKDPSGKIDIKNPLITTCRKGDKRFMLLNQKDAYSLTPEGWTYIGDVPITEDEKKKFSDEYDDSVPALVELEELQQLLIEFEDKELTKESE